MMPTLEFLQTNLADDFFEHSERIDVVCCTDASNLLRDSMRIAAAFTKRASQPGEIIVINTGVLKRPFDEKRARLRHQHGKKFDGFTLPIDELAHLADPIYRTFDAAKTKVVIVNSFEFAASTRSNRLKVLRLLTSLCNALNMRVILMTQQDPSGQTTCSGALRMLMDIATATTPLAMILGQIKEDRKNEKEDKVQNQSQEIETVVAAGEGEGEGFDRAALEAEGLTKSAIDRIEFQWRQQQSPYGDGSMLVPVFS